MKPRALTFPVPAKVECECSNSSPGEILSKLEIAFFEMTGTVADDYRWRSVPAIGQKEFANELKAVRSKANRFCSSHKGCTKLWECQVWLRLWIVTSPAVKLAEDIASD